MIEYSSKSNPNIQICDLWNKKLRSIRLSIIILSSKMENFAPTLSERFAIHRLSKVRHSDIFWKPAWRLPGWRSRVACVRVPPHKAARALPLRTPRVRLRGALSNRPIRKADSYIMSARV